MKGVLACSFLYWRSKTVTVCLLFLELKLDTKEGTANGRTHLHMFTIFIKKNKKNSEITYEKKIGKATEESK